MKRMLKLLFHILLFTQANSSELNFYNIHPGDSIDIKKWSREVFENVRFVNSDTINAILEDTSRGLPFFRRNIGRGFSTFSVPIFLRNDTYCLFYSDHYDAPLAGGGGLGLYRKENGKWKIVKYYCFWIS